MLAKTNNATATKWVVSRLSFAADGKKLFVIELIVINRPAGGQNPMYTGTLPTFIEFPPAAKPSFSRFQNLGLSGHHHGNKRMLREQQTK
ncbi:MAG: hypothetical protein WCC99_21125 [Candidatus Sulfotelmatobacter sp.]